MQRKTAKVVFIVLIVLAALGFMYLKKYGPETFTQNETRKKYKSYIKAQAGILAKETSGRVGKGENITFTIQFKDCSGKLQTSALMDNSFAGKALGDSLTVYYDPIAPADVINENSYDEVMP